MFNEPSNKGREMLDALIGRFAIGRGVSGIKHLTGIILKVAKMRQLYPLNIEHRRRLRAQLMKLHQLHPCTCHSTRTCSVVKEILRIVSIMTSVLLVKAATERTVISEGAERLSLVQECV